MVGFHEHSWIRWERPLFSVGPRSYSALDVLLAAVLRGDWHDLEEQVRAGVASVRRAPAPGVASVDLQKAAEEFRYARNLITAEETESWLERSGVTLEDWSAYLERSRSRQLWTGDIHDYLVEFPVPDDEIRACIEVEAICSGALARFAETLAGRVAVCHWAASTGRIVSDPHRCAVDPEEGRRAARAALKCGRVLGPSWETSAALEALQRTLAELAEIESAFQLCAHEALNRAAVEAQVEAHRIDWMRVAWRYVACADETVTREAALCIRHEGESLEEVATRAGTTVHREEGLLEQLMPEVRDAVFSATPNELVGPVRAGGEVLIGILDAKSAPSAADRDVHRRAQEEIVAALVAEHSQVVRWHDRV